MQLNCSIEVFERALSALDRRLGEEQIESIQIRAIGGFAMLYYGFRENGYTIDIDSLTEQYDEKVLALIREIAFEEELDEDWLNTDCALLDGFLDDLSSQIHWVDSKYHFSHIDLKIADIAGLIRSKAKAIHDGGLIPRSTDKRDLITGLRHIGINNLEELEHCEELSFIQSDYARCFHYLAEIEKW